MSTNPFETLFGKELIDSSMKSYSTAEKLPKTYVGIYFSALWCGPCRKFSPILKQAYSQLKEAGKNFEVVFCSWDNDIEGFKEYFGKMPWLAIPYEKEEIRKNLNAKFHITGIPALVMLGPDGELINDNARESVQEDPEFKEYPWSKKSIYDLLEGDFITDKEKHTIKSDVVKGKIFGVYFSASWCPSCRGFTPDLVDIHNKLIAKGVDFPIIWCSRDREEDAFLDYFSKMGVYAIPFGDSRRDPLYNSQGVKTIPCVCLFDEKGHRIRFDGRDAMVNDPEGYPWMPPAVVDVKTNPKDINEKPCIFCCTGNDSNIITAYNKISSEFRRETVTFIIANEETKVTTQIRGLTHISKSPALFVTDILQDGAYYEHEGEMNYDAMKKFIEDYFDNKVPRKQMG